MRIVIGNKRDVHPTVVLQLLPLTSTTPWQETFGANARRW